ncbi:MAG: hypothetical protein LBE03_01250 [Candidatus Nomurabacteria bacterium]|nr:hypothetical protein [Candidatus Nomurabacteria bacterium]
MSLFHRNQPEKEPTEEVLGGDNPEAVEQNASFETDDDNQLNQKTGSEVLKAANSDIFALPNQSQDEQESRIFEADGEEAVMGADGQEEVVDADQQGDVTGADGQEDIAETDTPMPDPIDFQDEKKPKHHFHLFGRKSQPETEAEVDETPSVAVEAASPEITRLEDETEVAPIAPEVARLEDETEVAPETETEETPTVEVAPMDEGAGTAETQAETLSSPMLEAEQLVQKQRDSEFIWDLERELGRLIRQDINPEAKHGYRVDKERKKWIADLSMRLKSSRDDYASKYKEVLPFKNEPSEQAYEQKTA